ncbi:uncharacterized protein METZ01_LOCUS147747, partial [marine metagenome]
MTSRVATAVLALSVSVICADAKTISGKVTGKGGKGMGGVFVSAHDTEHRKSTGVFTARDGSFVIDGLRDLGHKVRARLLGQNDVWLDDIAPGSPELTIAMTPATGWKLEKQRTADSAFAMLKFEDTRDKLNFKMFCSYCHQIGTV